MADVTTRTPAQRQQRLGWQAIAAFGVGTLLLWLASPVKQLVREHLLPYIAYQAVDQGFSAGFGALPALVKDGGGSQPVPFVQTVVHAPEYRNAEWIRARPAERWTLQVAVLTDEHSVLSFLSGREDRDGFRYFYLPGAGDGRFVLVTGDYASRVEAEMGGGEFNFANTPLPRTWSVYQGEARATAPAAVVSPPAAAPADISATDDEPSI